MLTGASVQLVAADPARQAMIIHNPDAANSLAFTINATAALNTAGSMTLLPGGYMLLDAFIVAQAIQVIGTNGSGVTCWTFP